MFHTLDAGRKATARNSAPQNIIKMKLYKPTTYRNSMKPIITQRSIDYTIAQQSRAKKAMVGSLDL